MRRLILGVTVAAPLAAAALFMAGAHLAALAVFVAGGVIVMTPILRPNVQWLGPVVTSFETSARELWLTIDDGPTGDTAALLDLLDERRVKATFFVKGTLAVASHEALTAIGSRGHTIGNHSHTHPSATFWCLPPAAIAREIDGCAAAIPPTSLFRAPIGMKNPFVHPALRERGMQLIGFGARAFDAVRRDPATIAAVIRRKLVPGAIVVLHQGRPWSLAAIAATIDAAHASGYSFVVPSTDRLKTNR